MYPSFYPWQPYLVILAGWVNKQQQLVIHYLITENQVLREVCGMKRILLTDDQRCPLKRFLHQRYSSASPEASSCKRCRSRIFANG